MRPSRQETDELPAILYCSAQDASNTNETKRRMILCICRRNEWLYIPAAQALEGKRTRVRTCSATNRRLPRTCIPEYVAKIQRSFRIRSFLFKNPYVHKSFLGFRPVRTCKSCRFFTLRGKFLRLCPDYPRRLFSFFSIWSMRKTEYASSTVAIKSAIIHSLPLKGAIP